MEVSGLGGSVAAAGSCAALEGTQTKAISKAISKALGAPQLFRARCFLRCSLPCGSPLRCRLASSPPLTDGETEAREFGDWPEVTKLGSG